MTYLTNSIRIGLVLITLMLSVSRSDGAFKIVGQEEPCSGTAPQYVYKEPNHPGDWASTISVAHTWGATGGVIVSGGGIGDITANVLWGGCGSGTVTLSLFVTYINTSGGVSNASFFTSLNVKVLQNLPPSITIGGPANVLCNSTEPVVFTANVPDCPGQNYAWQVLPGSWIIQSGQGTRSITVIPDLIHPAAVAVAVVSNQGCGNGTVTSTKLISRDCPTDIFYNTSTASLPVNSVAHNAVIADVGGGGLIWVPPFDTVLFKALNYISIKKNFVVSGHGVFLARIGPCTGCIALKKGPDPKEKDDDDDNGGISDLESSDPFSIKVCPNPSDGIYKITFEGDWQHLNGANQLRIYSMGGVLIKDISFHANETPFQIDLTDQPPGVYIFNLKTSEGDFMEKMIKQ